MIDKNIYTEHSIRTYTGKVFDITILNPDSICIEDIAHALSQTARFGGHLETMYSVAQHSIMCCQNVSKEFKLAALMHDASEAYIGDMPSPFKKLMPDYKAIEDRIMIAISKKFNFQYPLPVEVKNIDHSMLNFEWDALVEKQRDLSIFTPEHAKQQFLQCFNELTEK